MGSAIGGEMVEKPTALRAATRAGPNIGFDIPLFEGGGGSSEIFD